MLRLTLLCTVVAIATSIQHDATMTPNAAGSAVVEKVSELFQENCDLGDDKLFTRRVAYVETKDGQDPGTYRSGYHGGIWKVDAAMFKKTQDPAVLASLKPFIDTIRSQYNIEWSQIIWEDCRKPLVSALAQKLYIKTKAGASSIPREISAQAALWSDYYRPGGDSQTFIDDCQKLREACPAAKVDIVFVLDGSGSVGESNFGKTKKFVYDVVNTFTIGSDKTQVALVKYDSKVYHQFSLNKYSGNKAALLSAINSMSYPGGGTHTYDAIDHVVNSVFQYNYGGRSSDKVPHVAVIMTDGNSDEAKVKAAAARAHKAGITMFAVGIGSSINHNELNAIASEPKCFHKFELSGFQEVESLKYAIEKGSCDAPIIVDSGKGGSTIDTVIPTGVSINCKIKLTPTGATVKVEAKNGSATFYLASHTYPSDAYYENKTAGRPGYPGVIYIPTSSGLEDGTMFCNIEGSDTDTTDVEVVIDVGDTDRCKDSPCNERSTCIDQGKDHRCECLTGYTGADCETIADNCASSSCGANGKCQNAFAQYTCDCDDGWSKTNCDKTESYEVTVYTGSKFGAGTNANVYITIHGDQGSSGERLLYNEDRDNFETGTTHSFTLKSQDLGTLERINIGHDDSGWRSDWYLTKVDISSSVNTDRYTFPCDRWLRDEDIAVELKAERIQSKELEDV